MVVVGDASFAEANYMQSNQGNLLFRLLNITTWSGVIWVTTLIPIQVLSIEQLNLPPAYLLIHRVTLSTIGVLCQLGATVRLRDELEDWLPEFVPGEPGRRYPVEWLGYMEVGRVAESRTDELTTGDVAPDMIVSVTGPLDDVFEGDWYLILAMKPRGDGVGSGRRASMDRRAATPTTRSG